MIDPARGSLKVREDPKKGVYVEGCTEFKVAEEDDVLQLIQLGEVRAYAPLTLCLTHFCVLLTSVSYSGSIAASYD